MTDIKTKTTGSKPTLGERLFGVAAYLSWLSPLGFFAPLVLYYWKGRASRFIGFHTIQSTLLAFTLVLAMLAVGMLATEVLVHVTNGNALASAVYYTVMTVVIMLPLGSCAWMSVSVLLGRPTVLPVLGRWAKQITSPDVNVGE
jgi:uncharacterized membrane protein